MTSRSDYLDSASLHEWYCCGIWCRECLLGVDEWTREPRYGPSCSASEKIL